MASAEELATAYVQVLLAIERAPPLTLMNHEAEEVRVMRAQKVEVLRPGCLHAGSPLQSFGRR